MKKQGMTVCSFNKMLARLGLEMNASQMILPGARSMVGVRSIENAGAVISTVVFYTMNICLGEDFQRTRNITFFCKDVVDLETPKDAPVWLVKRMIRKKKDKWTATMEKFTSAYDKITLALPSLFPGVADIAASFLQYRWDDRPDEIDVRVAVMDAGMKLYYSFVWEDGGPQDMKMLLPVSEMEDMDKFKTLLRMSRRLDAL